MVSFILAAAGLCYAEPPQDAPKEDAPARHALFDFAEAAQAWPAINDGVMGGLSRGGMRAAQGKAVFSGEISLKNNGGFSSVRSRPGDYDLSNYNALALRVRGDGNRYKFRLRTTRAWDGVSYQAEFDTKEGQWMEIRLPLSDFRPVWRGRYLQNAEPLDTAEVKTFGLLISDKQEGAFRLEIDWVAGEIPPGS